MEYWKLCTFQEVSKTSAVPTYEPRGGAFESLRACQQNQARKPPSRWLSCFCNSGSQKCAQQSAQQLPGLTRSAGCYGTFAERRPGGLLSPEYSSQRRPVLLIVVNWRRQWCSQRARGTIVVSFCNRGIQRQGGRRLSGLREGCRPVTTWQNRTTRPAARKTTELDHVQPLL